MNVFSSAGIGTMDMDKATRFYYIPTLYMKVVSRSEGNVRMSLCIHMYNIALMYRYLVYMALSKTIGSKYL